jgi:hypothetical protein
LREIAGDSIPSGNILEQYDGSIAHNMQHSPHESVNFNFENKDGGSRITNIEKIIKIMLCDHSLHDKIEKGRAFVHAHCDQFDGYTIFTFTLMERGNKIYFLF